MPKQCTTEGCTYNVFSKGLCQQHWKQVHGKPIKPKVGDVYKDKQQPRNRDGTFGYKQYFKVVSVKPTNPIKKISTKQAKLNAAYSVLRQQFLKDHPYCQARWEGCTFIATQCHHSEGRLGGKMLDSRTYRALCHNCHVLVEIQVERAKEQGLSENRLDNYKS